MIIVLYWNCATVIVICALISGIMWFHNSPHCLSRWVAEIQRLFIVMSEEMNRKLLQFHAANKMPFRVKLNGILFGIKTPSVSFSSQLHVNCCARFRWHLTVNLFCFIFFYIIKALFLSYLMLKAVVLCPFLTVSYHHLFLLCRCRR